MTWENNYFLLRLSLNPGASVSAAPAFLPEGSALNEHPLSRWVVGPLQAERCLWVTAEIQAQLVPLRQRMEEESGDK